MRWLEGIAVAGALIAAQPASAAWHEASSGNFLIYADMSPQALQTFATRLERLDAALRYVFMRDRPVDEGARSNRLRIYVLPDVAAVRRLCRPGCDEVLGFYTPRAGGSVAFTPRRAGDGSRYDLDAETVLFHEYAHHFMYANFTAAYPAWYSEGFAEFSSTARFEGDGSLGLGAPAMHRAYELALGGGSVPVEKLLEAGVDNKDERVAMALYARGWLLTHYLTFTPERRGQLERYVALLNEGKPGLEAARAAFGDLDMLDRELTRYMKRPRMSYAVLPPAKTAPGPVAIRALGAGEAAMMPVHIRSTRGVNRKEALALLPEARRIAAGHPSDPVVQAWLAEAEFDAGNYAEADAAADRALAMNARSMRALLYKGMVAAERAEDSAAWRAVRGWFIKANKVDANAAEPLIHFYDSFARSGAKPSANAVAALHRAFQLAPEDRSTRLRVAVQAMRDKDTRLARRALGTLAFDPHGGAGLRNFAATAISYLDAGRLTEALALLERDVAEEAQADDDEG